MAKLKRPPRKSTRNAHARVHPAQRRTRKPAAPEFLSLQEIVLAARRNLSQDLWNHLAGGADSETTLKRNRQALDSLALRQRVLVDVRNIDLTTTLLGKTLSSPVFLAPVGGLVGFINPEQGAIPVARAAVAHGTTAFISTAAKPGFDAAAAAVDEPLIFQLYVRADRKWVEDILDRVKAAGYRALCVCVDRNYYGRRERDITGRACRWPGQAARLVARRRRRGGREAHAGADGRRNPYGDGINGRDVARAIESVVGARRAAGRARQRHEFISVV